MQSGRDAECMLNLFFSIGEETKKVGIVKFIKTNKDEYKRLTPRNGPYRKKEN